MDPADTRHQVAVWFFLLWVERITGEWNGLNLTNEQPAPAGNTHQQTSTPLGGIGLLQTGRSQRVMEGIGLLEAFQVFVGWL